MKVRAAMICRVRQERPCVAAEAANCLLGISSVWCKYRIDGPLRLNPLPGAAPGAALLGIQSRFRAKSSHVAARRPTLQGSLASDYVKWMLSPACGSNEMMAHEFAAHGLFPRILHGNCARTGKSGCF